MQVCSPGCRETCHSKLGRLLFLLRKHLYHLSGDAIGGKVHLLEHTFTPSHRLNSCFSRLETLLCSVHPCRLLVSLTVFKGILQVRHSCSKPCLHLLPCIHHID